MILSVCKAGDKIILPRNVHKSAINALVLCGAVPVYVNPEVNGDLGISLGMDIRKVEKAIEENPDAVAVLVNNPTYYGICSDLRGIVKLAHEKGMKCWQTKPMGLICTLERTSCECNGSRCRYGSCFHAQVRRKPDTKLHAPFKQGHEPGLCASDH